MDVRFTKKAYAQYKDWERYNKRIFSKINILIQDILRTPEEGIGRPEMLKHELSGYYSRRIDREHRLVYIVENDIITIISCKYHYG
jgi:toxin YoeB